ncbi:MAG: nucleoid-associated protein [Pseudomonadota bacterium]|nr:nucleoid-associated protein [Pseudomonadota bacterium]
MQVENFIIHGVEKDQHTQVIKKDFERDTVIPVETPQLQKFLEDLRSSYRSTNPSYGVLKTDQDANFTKHLNAWLADSTDFAEFSKLSFRLIKNNVRITPQATGGIVAFLEYKQHGSRYLMIVMLKEKNVMQFKEDDNSLEPILSIDLANLNEAARIDLDKFAANDQSYLSFVTKNTRRGATDYFRTAIDCDDETYLDSKTFTQNIMVAVKGFCESKGWSSDKHSDAKSRLFDLFEGITNLGKKGGSGKVNLTVISAVIDPDEPEALLKYVQENDEGEKGFKIDYEFQPHREEYLKIKRFKATQGDIRFSFNKADLDSEKVKISEEKDGKIEVTFVIESPDIMNQINEFKDEGREPATD